MHKAKANILSEGFAEPRRHLQGPSLFGLEHFGEAGGKGRPKFGYTAVRMEMAGDRGRLQLWPRIATRVQDGSWRLGPDTSYELLSGLSCTPPADFPLNAPIAAAVTAAFGPLGTPTLFCHESATNTGNGDDFTVERRGQGRPSALLFVLGYCAEGLPREVIEEVFPDAKSQVSELTNLYIDERALQERGAYKLARSVSGVAEPENCEALLGRTLDALLRFVEQHRSDGAGLEYAASAVALARSCKGSCRHVVLKLFNTVDRLLKRLGDKNLVHAAATLSIEASCYDGRGDSEVQIHAKALICGKSWVLQRVGHLKEALVDAEKSLELGRRIGWDRNTAFCQKCIGRIYRMLAQEEEDPVRRHELLATSVRSLRDAIDSFGSLGGFGPQHPEVGDCYSLLARTLLVANQREDARKALNKASKLLVDEKDKDYLDYLLLEGDYAAADGRPDVAEQYYDRVISSVPNRDAEKSEILGRAHFQRGLVRRARRNAQGACMDFNRAAEIRHALREPRSAAGARWEAILTAGTLSATSVSNLLEFDVMERVSMVRMHEANVTARASKHAKRKEPSRPYWKRIQLLAREESAKQDIGW